MLHCQNQQVCSSIARRLGIDIGGLTPADRNVEGVVEMMLDATSDYGLPLTEERLFAWHASLFPAGRSGMKRIRTGEWRGTDAHPMQVVSGAVGHERVHFEAPSAARVPEEIRQFLDWFEGNTENDMVERASLAHLWFVTIHPFEDGNGRIARAIADLMLARSEQSSQRFYSMSSQIRQERDAYYDSLERTQKGSMDVTPWMDWFLGCLESAIEGAQTALGAVLNKAEVWKQLANARLNDRQRVMLNRFLDGFDGKLTTSKWSKLTKCSPDTALRDIQALVDAGILVRTSPGGRSTSYALANLSDQ